MINIHGSGLLFRYLVRDVVPRMPKGYWYTLLDIGNVINMLMGGGFKCSYTRRRFRRIYVETTSPMRLKLPFKLSKSFTYNTTTTPTWSSITGSLRENGSSSRHKQPLETHTAPGNLLTVPGGGGLPGLQTALTLHKTPSVASHDSCPSTIIVGQTAVNVQDDIYGSGPSNQFFDRFVSVVGFPCPAI